MRALAVLGVVRAGIACSDTSRVADERAARTSSEVQASQLGVFYDVRFRPAPSLADVTAAHPTASVSQNLATLLRELGTQAEPAWPSGVMMLPALTGIGGTQLYAPSPATNRIRFSCGITLVSPSYAITAGHCVTDDSDFSGLTLRLYRVTPALAKTYVPALLSGTFPSYTQPNLSADDGFLFDDYHCTLENRCYDTSDRVIDCPANHVQDDMALLHCEGRPGDKYGFLNVNNHGSPAGKEALVHWVHEVLDLGGPESSLSTDLITHYVQRTGDVTQNYHYFENAADLLPLRSITWADGTPTTWVTSTAVDVHGCHGTSGSGLLVRVDDSPVYELVGPTALAGSAFGTRLCEQVPNPGGTTSGKGTAAMLGDGMDPNDMLALHTSEIEADCRARAVSERDVDDLPFAAGSHHVATIFSHLDCQNDDFGADGTVTADPVFGAYPEKFVADASGADLDIGGFKTEANADYRMGAQVMPRAACSSNCGSLTLKAHLGVFQTSPHLTEPSTVAAVFPSPGTYDVSAEIANSGQLRAFGGIVLIREGQVNSFDTVEDRLEVGLYALDAGGAVLAGPLPGRFAGDGKAGFEALLRPGERFALLRQAIAPGREWTVRLGAPSYADLTCGLLDRKGAPLASTPCAALMHFDDHAGTEARLGFYIELGGTSSRENAEIRSVALATDAARDTDADGIPEVLDNCPGAWNPSQGSCNEVPPGAGGTGGTGTGGDAGDNGLGGEGGEATSGRGGTDTSAGQAGDDTMAEPGGNGGEDGVTAGTSGSSMGGMSGLAGGGAGGTAGITSGSANGGSTSGTAGATAFAGTAGTATAPSTIPPPPKSDSGCGCRITNETHADFGWAALALALAASRRRRRRAYP